MSRKYAISWVQLITAACLSGFLIFGSKLLGESGFSLVQVLAIPQLIVAAVLFKYAYKDAKFFYSFPLWLVIVYPLNQVCDSMSQILPVYMGVSVSMTAFLNYTQPLWTILISVVFLKAKLKSYDVVTAAIMFTGLVVLLEPWNAMEENLPLLGCFVAFLGGLCISLWIIFNAYFVRNDMPPLSLAFYSSVYQPGFIFLMYPLIVHCFPQPNISGFGLDKPLWAWALMITYALSVYLLANVLFYKSSKKIQSIYLGLTFLLEPVVAAMLDVAFFDTELSWNLVLGGALIIGANAFIMIKGEPERPKRGRRRRKNVNNWLYAAG